MNDFLYEGSDGELYHWGIKKGEAKPDHKYTRRYWKNGRWNYVYEDGTVTEGRSIGQNYKTPNDVKKEQASKESEQKKKANKEAETKATEKRVHDFVTSFKDLVERGKERLSGIEMLMSSTPADTFKYYFKK